MSHFRVRSSHLLIAALCLLAGSSRQTRAVPPSAREAVKAVVRAPSHGASATVIFTEKGRTFLLGCGHAFQGRDRNRPMVLDVPASAPVGKEIACGIKLIAVDYDLDLSLVQLDAGPLAYSATVPARDYRYGREIVSVGFDHMRAPAACEPATVLKVTAATTYTREHPVPGRSGGALLDLDGGRLVGVVQGFETDGPRRGLYVSLPAVLTFLGKQGWSVEKTPERTPINEGRADPRAPLLDPRWLKQPQEACPSRA